MAQMPIPKDWDGTSYCCQVVEWPASVEWQAIFVGLMTMPSVGRFWDASTGSVKEAQDIGKDINDRNCYTKEDA